MVSSAPLDTRPLAAPSVSSPRRFPDCFRDHNAPPSVRSIFPQLVTLGDASDNGMIEVDRGSFLNPHTNRPYSGPAVDNVVGWLIAHRLLMLVESRRGRGRHSRYFIRWSFRYETLTARQEAINHAPVKCKVPYPSEEENPGSRETSFRRTVRARAPDRVSLPTDRTGDRVSDRSRRWLYAQLRAAPKAAFPDRPPKALDRLSDGLIVATHRAIGRGDLGPGAILGRFIDAINGTLGWLEPAQDFLDDDPWTPECNRISAYAGAGKIVRDSLASLALERRPPVKTPTADRTPTRPDWPDERTPTRYTSPEKCPASLVKREVYGIRIPVESPRNHERNGTGEHRPDRLKLRKQSCDHLDAFLAEAKTAKLSDFIRALVEPEQPPGGDEGAE